ncbi:hypothetical protein, partial [Campylobacter sp.]|uniref:hypothetical protein n=1 Tax=Campylobacter sp. TaxID=205 RepID=UPI002A839876
PKKAIILKAKTRIPNFKILGILEFSLSQGLGNSKFIPKNSRIPNAKILGILEFSLSQGLGNSKFIPKNSRIPRQKLEFLE